MDTADPSTTSPGDPSRPPLFLESRRRPGSKWSWPARAAFMFTGVVLPIICFAISLPDPPEWQSGNLQDYAQLLLAHKPSVPLYPFLLYNMTCMTLLVFAPGRFVKSFVVRFGIYTGVLLAVQYWVVFVIALAGDANPFAAVSAAALYSSLAVFIPSLIACGLVLLLRRFGWTILGLIVTLVFVLSIALGIATGTPSLIFPFLVFILCLACSIPWAVACYGIMAIYVARHSGVKRFRFSLAQLLGVVTWLAAFLGACRTSVLWMLQEYAKLPTTPPEGCYVSTAAARGHCRLVGAEEYAAPSGKVYRVNDQMRYLKAAELLLAALSPPAHRTCRRVYDRIGPVLAARLAHPLLADAAYLSLKPAEWSCRAGLALLLPDRGQSIRRLYRPEASRSSTCRAAAPGKPARAPLDAGSTTCPPQDTRRPAPEKCFGTKAP